MFDKSYYCLVAGLREYTLDADNKGFNAVEIVADIREQLGSKDLKALDLFYGYYDVLNVVAMRGGRAQFSELGTFSREELAEELKKPERLPKYIARVLEAYNDSDSELREDIDVALRLERNMFDAYYEECAKSSNKFLRAWSATDRTIRNLCAAYTARAKGLAIGEVVVGSDDYAEAMSRSSASDFGLKSELDYLEQVQSIINDEQNMVEKERRLDLLRWNIADDLATFNYFDMAAILAYLCKINIIHRWTSLDERVGQEMYKKLMAELTSTKENETQEE